MFCALHTVSQPKCTCAAQLTHCFSAVAELLANNGLQCYIMYCLTRCRLKAVLVATFCSPAVVLLLSCWGFSSPSAMCWNCIDPHRQNNAPRSHNTSKEFWERYCTARVTSSQCLTVDKLPPTVGVSTTETCPIA